ncbi:MAG: hypothetical protein IT244_10995 [Bacteroidia bacterium]|nr:hypothetical protein [Bacteroidia bacterium]
MKKILIFLLLFGCKPNSNKILELKNEGERRSQLLVEDMVNRISNGYLPFNYEVNDSNLEFIIVDYKSIGAFHVISKKVNKGNFKHDIHIFIDSHWRSSSEDLRDSNTLIKHPISCFKITLSNFMYRNIENRIFESLKPNKKDHILLLFKNKLNKWQKEYLNASEYEKVKKYLLSISDF